MTMLRVALAVVASHEFFLGLLAGLFLALAALRCWMRPPRPPFMGRPQQPACGSLPRSTFPRPKAQPAPRRPSLREEIASIDSAQH